MFLLFCCQPRESEFARMCRNHPKFLFSFLERGFYTPPLGIIKPYCHHNCLIKSFMISSNDCVSVFRITPHQSHMMKKVPCSRKSAQLMCLLPRMLMDFLGDERCTQQLWLVFAGQPRASHAWQGNLLEDLYFLPYMGYFESAKISFLC